MSDPGIGEFTAGDGYDNAIDPAGAAQREAEQRDSDRKAEKRRQLLAGLMADPEVRDWLWEFLTDCHAFEARFASTGYSPDPYGTFLYAGEQKAGWHLWAQLDDAAPDLASLMRREHLGRLST